jgi:CelD/BcsL family acetyltransferase involved in cellulose biosynthesis
MVHREMVLSIKQVTSLADLSSLRPVWAALQTHPNADLEQFQLVCESRAEVVSPLVVIVERDGRTCALLAARLERASVTPQIGYLRVVGLQANVISVIHHGVMGNIDQDIAVALLSHLRSLLAGRHADIVVLHHIAESSPLHAAARSKVARWWWEPEERWATHRSMSIPDGPDVLFRKLRSKHRSYLRSRLKGLEALESGNVRWRWISVFDDIPALCKQIESVAALTYQRGLGAGFFDDEEHRRRFTIFAQQHALRVQLLEVGDRVSAFWIGLVFGDTFHSWATGYRPEVAEFDAGTLTLAKTLDELANEGVRVFDFGLGEAHYKVRFGDTSWRETSPRVFAHTLKGHTLRCVLACFGQIDNAARRILDSARALDKVKTAWRRMVRPSSARSSDKPSGADA